MHDLDTRHKFIELRAKGHSLDRISKRLKVSKRTLIEWSRQERVSIRTMRAVELEALQERILDSRETQLRGLQNNLTRIQEAIGEVAYKYVEPEKLYRMAAMIRSEIRKVCETPDMLDAALARTKEREAVAESPPAQTQSSAAFPADPNALANLQSPILNQRSPDPSEN